MLMFIKDRFRTKYDSGHRSRFDPDSDHAKKIFKIIVKYLDVDSRF